MDFKDYDMQEDTLSSWVMVKADTWREHYESNYQSKFEEYTRIWRGIWSSEDKTKNSERSKIVTPATLQAVEINVAELEEATFGRGRFFDIKDDVADQNKTDIDGFKKQLEQDFKNYGIRKDISDCLINAAVYGTAVAEVVLEEVKEMRPASEPIMGGDLTAVGVNVTDRVVVKLKPVQPQNFLIDPVATSVNNAVGCIIDEYVPRHSVELLQEAGVYADVEIAVAYEDSNLNADNELTIQPKDKVRLTKYFGYVPRSLLSDASEDYEDVVGLIDEDPSEGASELVEAIVVIANGETILKAEENPYMMEDRPVISFQWDAIPNSFYGMGVVEKAYNSQKALDAEIRARIDALALTVHPMMGVDATRIPRGAKPEIKAGKMLLTNGDPAQVLKPFNFGSVDQITFAQAGALNSMVQDATGAVSATSMSSITGTQATAGGASMSMSSVIKRQKRTLINFQECFLVPFIKKAAWRYMQFEPDLYPAADYNFVITSSLGTMAREFEVSQLTQLLQTVQQGSPEYSVLLQAIIDNTNINDREKLKETIKQSGQPSEEQQKAQQESQQAELAFKASQTAALNGQAEESMARAKKYDVESRGVPVKLQNDQIKAVGSLDSDDDKNFEKRMKIANLALNETSMRLSKPPVEGNTNGSN
tara:strand:+ start:14110 stop:16059 length:1950 start_codon:yes stop_codon:yes gene_type:complete